MSRTVKVDGKEIKLSSEKLSQRLLASAVQGNCLVKDLFSYELAAVAPALFLGNGMMRKMNKAELMIALLLALSPCIIKTYSADTYHAIMDVAGFIVSLGQRLES